MAVCIVMQINHLDEMSFYGILFPRQIYIIFIQSGGGTGPMKPGNRYISGANSCGIIPRDKDMLYTSFLG